MLREAHIATNHSRFKQGDFHGGIESGVAPYHKLSLAACRAKRPALVPPHYLACFYGLLPSCLLGGLLERHLRRFPPVWNVGFAAVGA